MKKWIVGGLVLVFTLAFAGTGFAAPNAFDDVPAKHWAYDAINKLERDGILQSAGDHSYQGDKVITRYEMAVMIANAMARQDKADAEDTLLIHNLEIEFAADLNNLGVHVVALEKKVDKLMVIPSIFYRYDYVKTKNATVNGHLQQYGGTSGTNRDQTIDIPFDTLYKINDNWTFWHQIEWQRDFWRSDALYSSAHDQVKIMNVSGKVGSVTVTAGRYLLDSAECLVFSDIATGAQVAFGDKTRVSLNFGTIDQYVGAHHSTDLLSVNSPRYMSVVTSYQLNKTTTVKADCHRVYTADGSVAGQNYFEGGVERKLSDKLAINVGYVKSTFSTDNVAYLFQIGSPGHGPDMMKVGDSYWWVTRGRTDINANLVPKYGLYDNGHGATGVEIGYNFVPMVKTIFTLRYDDMRATTAGDNWRQKWYRAQIQYFM
ncbi:MAG: S-layer y domain protein [Firmicutes bacterium]|nr:S-layer y domain protein [Bacillota bacterium]